MPLGMGVDLGHGHISDGVGIPKNWEFCASLDFCSHGHIVFITNTIVL